MDDLQDTFNEDGLDVLVEEGVIENAEKNQLPKWK